MQKSLKILLSVIGTAVFVAAATAIIIFSRSNMSAMNTYRNISDIYSSLRNNIDSTQITVYEDEKEIGQYSLEELGLIDDIDSLLQSSVNSIKVYSEDEFKKLSLKEKTLWCSSVEVASSVEIDISGADLSPIFADLNAVERIQSQDAQVVYENGKFTLVSEVVGTEIDEEKLSAYIMDSLEGMNIDLYNDGSLTLDIEDTGCYILPEVTLADMPDYDTLFNIQLSKHSLEIVFHSGTVKMSTSLLARYFSANSRGEVIADMDGLRAFAADWSEKYAENNVPYIFDSFVGGAVPISFLRCNYSVDTESTINEIVNHILAFDFEPVDAVYECFNTRGEPFSIGDTYVEVDIENQHMTFYKNGELIIDTPVVTGLPGDRHTPTGLYYAYDKQTDRVLTGDDFCVFVNYWVRFYEGYGLHDASWRTVFGGQAYLTNGSHGCVNTPTEAMAVIYENIEDGDPVLVF